MSPPRSHDAGSAHHRSSPLLKAPILARIALVTRLTPAAESAWLEHLRRAMPGEQIDPVQDLSTDERTQVDIAIVANPDPADLAQLPNLVWVQSLWAGVERLVSELGALSRPIVRLVDPELSRTMSEAVLAWTYYLFREMPTYAAQQRTRDWAPLPYRRPSRTTIGLLGLGELGRASAARLQEVGFDVQGWSRGRKDLPGINCHCGEGGLNALLARSEILVCLLPLTAETRGMLNARRLARLPHGAQIINFARGPIIDDPALLAALDSGKVAHAVLDVFDTEPLPASSPFWGHPAVTVLPHISATTDPESAAQIVAGNIAGWRRDATIPEAVDLKRGY